MLRPVEAEGAPEGADAPGEGLETPPALPRAQLGPVLAALRFLFAAADDAWGEPPDAPGVPERRALADAAVLLARTVASLRPDEPEARSLLALMLLRHARRDARADGAARTLAEHDRSLWRHDEIAEGRRILEDALAVNRPGPYLVAAAIEALHDDAPTAADTEWDEILALYDVLAALAPSPRVVLERAVARGMAQGVHAGLVALDELAGTPGLDAELAAARAELLRRGPRDAPRA